MNTALKASFENMESETPKWTTRFTVDSPKKVSSKTDDLASDQRLSKNDHLLIMAKKYKRKK